MNPLQGLRSLSLALVALSSLLVLLVDAQCTDVHVVFARGSGEMAGFGICGQPLVQGITSNLQGMSVSSYAVNYMADVAQTSAGPGATDMTNHVVKIAQQCPNTVFVLGGYSQGASVTDIALGIRTSLGSGQVIPTSLAPRIKAVVTFGNPLKLTGGTIAKQSQLYGSKAIEICNVGDPVCAGGFNFMAHTTYPTDGGVARAAQQAAQLVRAGGGASSQAQTTPRSESRSSSDSNGFPSVGQGQGNAPVNTGNLPSLGQGQGTTGTSGGLPSLGGGGIPGLGGSGGIPGLGGSGGTPGLGGSGGIPGLGGSGGIPGLGGSGGMPSFGQGLGGTSGAGGMPSFGFGNFLRGSS